MFAGLRRGLLRIASVPETVRRMAAKALGPVEERLVAQLTAAFSPAHLEVHNESHKHSVPAGSETHFKVFVVSAAFEGQPILARHRAVNDAVRDPSTGNLPVHALSVQAMTPAQWGAGAQVHNTPPCRGGAGK